VKGLTRELPKRALETFTEKYVTGSALQTLPERTKEPYLTQQNRRELQAAIAKFDTEKAKIVEMFRRMLL
jgi:flagellar biosynthesis chaperone FliJ